MKGLPSPTEPVSLELARLVVSRDALLTLQAAARLIGGREAKGWIEAHVPVRYVAGQRRVLWADVLAASDRQSGMAEARPVGPSSAPKRRVRLANV